MDKVQQTRQFLVILEMRSKWTSQVDVPIVPLHPRVKLQNGQRGLLQRLFSSSPILRFDSGQLDSTCTTVVLKCGNDVIPPHVGSEDVSRHTVSPAQGS
jgi:hypothetical protein